MTLADEVEALRLRRHDDVAYGTTDENCALCQDFNDLARRVGEMQAERDRWRDRMRAEAKRQHEEAQSD